MAEGKTPEAESPAKRRLPGGHGLELGEGKVAVGHDEHHNGGVDVVIHHFVFARCDFLFEEEAEDDVGDGEEDGEGPVDQGEASLLLLQDGW